MNKQFFMVIAALLLSAALKAQEKELSKEQKAQIQTQINTFSRDLDLTEDQLPKFEEITLRYGKEMIRLKESDQSRFSKYKAFKSLNKSKNEELSTLLSTKQLKTYLEIQEERQQKMRAQIRKKN